MSKIWQYPTSAVRSGRFLFSYYEAELYLMAKLHMFLKQPCSQLQGYGSQNFVSGTPSSLTHVHPYTFTDLKRLFLHLFASKNNVYSLSYLSNHVMSGYPSLHFFSSLLKQPESSPLCTAWRLPSHPGRMWLGDSWADVNSHTPNIWVKFTTA